MIRKTVDILDLNLPCVYYNKYGKINFISEKFREMLNIESDIFIGKNWAECGIKFFLKDGTEIDFDTKLKTVINLGNSSDTDLILQIFREKENRTIWTKMSLMVFPEEEPLAISLFTDLTEEMSIINSYEYFLASLNIGTWLWNVQTGELKINNNWASIIGYTLEELAPVSIDTWRRYSHPEDLKNSNEILTDYFEGEISTYSCEARMRHKDGRWVTVLDTGTIISRDKEGKAEWMTGTHQDISAIKTIELNLINNLKIEKLFADITVIFSQATSFDEALNTSFEMFGKLSGASRVYYFIIHKDGLYTSNTHEWCSDRVSPEIDNLQNIPISEIPWWIEHLSKNKIIDISNVSAMPPEASNEKAILEAQNIKSVLVLPVFFKDSLNGFIGIDEVQRTNIWVENEHSMLKIFVNLIVSLIEKMEYESERKKNFENLENFFNTQPDLVSIIDLNGNTLKINRSMTLMTGYTEEELVGKSILLLHPESMREEAAKIFEEMVIHGRLQCHLPIVTKTRKIISVQTNVNRGKWNDEEVFFAISKDVTQLLLSQERFSKIFKYSPVISCLVDFKTKNFIEINDTFVNKLGYSLEELKGFKATQLFEPLFKLEDNIFEKLEDQGIIRGVEVKLEAKSGVLINVNISISLIELYENKFCLILATDTTETMKTLEELKLAKERAEESDRLKSAFLATMNHELRTPLSHIIGFSSLIPDITDDSRIKELGKLMNQSGLSLLSIIEDIFELALLEQSEVRLREDKVFLRDIFFDIKNISKTTLEASSKIDKIEFKYIISPEIVTELVIADKSKVIQVISNIIKNAVKFTDKGRITVGFSLKSNNILSISVKDTGIGIAKEKQNILFDFFRQIDDSHTRQFSGVGIGLAISKKIAKAMRGDIFVNSQLGSGSEFIFEFPVKPFNPENLDDIIGEEEFALNSKGETILIVEDEVVSLEMIEMILSKVGYKTLLAQNGLQAVEICKDTNPDLILMDLKMPVLDGFEATKILRDMGITTPIIAFTAYSFGEEVKRAMESGCNGVIIKPVNKNNLLQSIGEILKM